MSHTQAVSAPTTRASTGIKVKAGSVFRTPLQSDTMEISTPSETKAQLIDHRAAQRFGLALRLTVDGDEGVTHDLSATGLYFESQTGYVPGQTIEMVLEFPGITGTRKLNCEAEVVRVTPVGQGFNVAVRLLTPLFP